MLTFVLLIVLGMAGVFFAEINGHIFQGKRNLPVRQIRFLIGKKVLPAWMIIVYVAANIIIWVGVIGVLARIFG